MTLQIDSSTEGLVRNPFTLQFYIKDSGADDEEQLYTVTVGENWKVFVEDAGRELTGVVLEKGTTVAVKVNSSAESFSLKSLGVVLEIQTQRASELASELAEWKTEINTWREEVDTWQDGVDTWQKESDEWQLFVSAFIEDLSTLTLDNSLEGVETDASPT